MRQSIAHNTVWLTGSLVAQKVLSLVYFALIARTLGVENTGVYVFVVSFVALFGIIADSGLTPVAIREVAREKDHSQFSPHLSRALVASVRIKFFLIFAAAFLAVACAYILGYDRHTLLLILATTGVMAIDSIHVFAYGLLRGLQNLSYEAMGMFFGQVIVVIVGWNIVSDGGSMFMLIGALASGSLLNVAQSVYHVWKSGIRVSLWMPITRADFIHVIRMAWPFAAAGILARGYAQIDIVLLSRLSDLSAVGLYSVPSKLVFAFQFIPIALSAALYPAMSRASATSSERLSLIVHRSMLFLAVVAAPLIMMLFIMSSFIVTYVFGESYLASAALLQVLCFSLLFGFLDFPIGSLLNATNMQRFQTFSMFLTLCINLAFNVMLIPRMGALGATVAAVVGQAVLFGSGLHFARRVLSWDISFFVRNGLRIVTAIAFVSVGSYLAMPWFSSLVSGYTSHAGQLLAIFVALCAMGIVYTLLILLMRVIRLSELISFARQMKR